MTNKADVSEEGYGNQSIKTIDIVSDPNRIRIMLDETRSEILKIMRMGVYRQGILSYDMSVSEISDRIGSAPQRIYHHVDKLVEYRFLMKSREEKKVRSITTYYQRTAKAFIINYDSDNPSKDLANKTDEWVRNMLSSFNIHLNSNDIYILIELISRLGKKSALIIENLSTKVSSNVSYKDFDRTFGFLNDILLHNDPDIKEIKDAISGLIIPKLYKPEIDQKVKNDQKLNIDQELDINQKVEINN